MMDSLLLLFAARISKRQVKRKRIFLGAAAGSLLTCLVIALPIPSAALKMILFHGFVNVFMLKAGLGVNVGKGPCVCVDTPVCQWISAGRRNDGFPPLYTKSEPVFPAGCRELLPAP